MRNAKRASLRLEMSYTKSPLARPIITRRGWIRQSCSVLNCFYLFLLLSRGQNGGKNRKWNTSSLFFWLKFFSSHRMIVHFIMKNSWNFFIFLFFNDNVNYKRQKAGNRFAFFLLRIGIRFLHPFLSHNTFPPPFEPFECYKAVFQCMIAAYLPIFSPVLCGLTDFHFMKNRPRHFEGWNILVSP